MARRFELVLDLLHDARLDALLDPSIAFGQAPSAFARLSADPGGTVHTVFSYEDG
jgi:hypothetical protein